jgi:hypothetical protein
MSRLGAIVLDILDEICDVGRNEGGLSEEWGGVGRRSGEGEGKNKKQKIYDLRNENESRIGREAKKQTAKMSIAMI